MNDGQEFKQDVIVLPDRVMPNWWREKGHSLSPDDLEVVMNELPAELIIGQGPDGRMKVPRWTLTALENRGFTCWVGPTMKAVARYKQVSSINKVAALLHLTC